jgi:pilus assembly protein Flp/PilA
MRSLVRRFTDDELGATAVEYAMIAGIIALGIIVSVGSIRDSLNGIFSDAAGGLK